MNIILSPGPPPITWLQPSQTGSPSSPTAPSGRTPAENKYCQPEELGINLEWKAFVKSQWQIFTANARHWTANPVSYDNSNKNIIKSINQFMLICRMFTNIFFLNFMFHPNLHNAHGINWNIRWISKKNAFPWISGKWYQRKFEFL